MRIKPVVDSVCAAAIALAATPASAYEPQSNTVAKEKQGQAQQQQKKICRWLPVTGSNRQERHCLTAEDWKKAEAMSW